MRSRIALGGRLSLKLIQRFVPRPRSRPLLDERALIRMPGVGQIRKLMGYEPLTKYLVLLVTFLQLAIAFLLRHTPFFSLHFFALAYIIGGTANQNTFLAVHEITHNLAFRGVKANRLFAIVANVPIGVPFAMMFKKYHIEHHKVCLLLPSLLLPCPFAEPRRCPLPC